MLVGPQLLTSELLTAFGPLLWLMVMCAGLAFVLWIGYTLYGIMKRQDATIARLQAKQDYYARLRTVTMFRNMDPFEFEHYITWLYRKLGFKAEATVARQDGGIDVVAENTFERVAIQVKKYGANNYVQRQEVQAFYGSYRDEGFNRGIFITTSKFSDRSIEYASGKNLELIDGTGLERLREQVV